MSAYQVIEGKSPEDPELPGVEHLFKVIFHEYLAMKTHVCLLLYWREKKKGVSGPREQLQKHDTM